MLTTSKDDGPRNLPPANGSWNSGRLSLGRIADYKPEVFVDGPGVRASLYVSGCPFRCVGCYNRAAQSFRYGYDYTAELEDRILTDLAKTYMAGLSLLGGEPFLNTKVCLSLARRVKAELPEKKIWVWSGYTWEQLQESIASGNADQAELLGLCNVLVDGPFIQSQFDSQLAFRGSANQRILDVQESLQASAPILWEKDTRTNAVVN